MVNAPSTSSLGPIMELTRAVLTEMLKALRSNPKTGMEKRVKPRVGLRLRARVFTAAAIDHPLEVWLRDVSAGGLGMLSSQPFAHGETIKMILADSDDDL